MTDARSLVDTSVWLSLEQQRPLDAQVVGSLQPYAVSVVTYAELHAGVLAAVDNDTRSQRLATMQAVEVAEVVPIDDVVAREWSRLRVFLAQQHRRLGVNDLWIAATASARGLPLITQDHGFQALEGARGVEIVLV